MAYLDRNGAVIDEFTVARIKSIGRRFAELYAASGRKEAAKYLDKQRLKVAHFDVAKECINEEMSKRGLKF